MRKSVEELDTETITLCENRHRARIVILVDPTNKELKAKYKFIKKEVKKVTNTTNTMRTQIESSLKGELTPDLFFLPLNLSSKKV
jgi:hypothetical protein